MAFPTVVGTEQGSSGITTDHTVDLPAGILAGNLLLVIFTITKLYTITFPDGWIELMSYNGFAFDPKTTIMVRLADGTEGASITVTTDTAVESSFLSYLIDGGEDAVFDLDCDYLATYPVI